MLYWMGSFINLGSPVRMLFFCPALCFWYFNLTVNRRESSIPSQKCKVPMLPVVFVKGEKVKIVKEPFSNI